MMTEASSERMSPNMLLVRMTSKSEGFWMSFIAALSTNMVSKVMSA